jgi:murein DD-endopeptidase MepM/ murein hydrolase activator NlpD
MDKLNLNTNQPEKKKKKKKGAHFYTAVAICILAVGVAGYTTYDSIKRFAGPDEDALVSKTQQRYQVQTTIEPSDDEISSSSYDYSSVMSSLDSKKDANVQAQETAAVAEVLTIIYPTSKDIIKGHSGDTPVFSKTLNDWRVHNGIDLAAEQGSKIKAITNGKVADIFNDELLGTTMVIEHDGGFTAFYSGLGETTLVNAGDTVESGQEIASINDIPCEAADGYHLHLSIKKDDNFIDPVEILG